MVLGRGKLLQEESLRSNLQVENVALDSSKDDLSMVTVWRAETHECINRQEDSCGNSLLAD